MENAQAPSSQIVWDLREAHQAEFRRLQVTDGRLATADRQRGCQKSDRGEREQRQALKTSASAHQVTLGTVASTGSLAPVRQQCGDASQLTHSACRRTMESCVFAGAQEYLRSCTSVWPRMSM